MLADATYIVLKTTRFASPVIYPPHPSTMASTETTSWLITGASRGIGLELTRQLLVSPNNIVLATCRTPATATKLQALQGSAKGTLHILALDVSSTASIEAVLKPAQDLLGDRGLDYLFNNAAIITGFDFGFAFNPEELMATLQTNVVGPAHLAQTLLPLLEKGTKKVILNTSSELASLGLDLGYRNPICATYSMSKAAVNMLTYKQAKHRPDFTVISIDPGWAKTDMGGEFAVVEPEASVSGMLKIARNVTLADSGSFYCYDGSKHPW